MLSHVVLLTLKADLSLSDRAALVSSLEQALLEIPSVREARVGRRIRHGAVYELLAPEAEYLAILDFEDLEGLRLYLRHPAHATLGERFGHACCLVQVCDFEMHPPEQLHAWLVHEAATTPGPEDS